MQQGQSSDFAKTNSHDGSYKKGGSVMVFLKDFFLLKKNKRNLQKSKRKRKFA